MDDEGDEWREIAQESLRRENRGVIFKWSPIGSRWIFRWEWKPADLWIGAFWRRDEDLGDMHVWVCILPMLPLHVTHTSYPRSGRIRFPITKE